jgi:uncharacterized protein (TIGR03083 family)
MKPEAYINALARDGGALGAAAVDHLDADVAACPGWSMADLVYHAYEVHHFWRSIVAGRLAEPDVQTVARPADDVLLSAYRAGLEELVATLSAVDPAMPVWSWSPQKDAAFVLRRMAQETAVHCWDAEAAAGRPQPVEPVLAADGIDEFLHFFFPGQAADAPVVGGSVHLHCTDTEGEWVVRDEDVTREHAKGDAAIRGLASDLLLVLWRRLPLDTVEVIGDGGIALRFVARPDLD